MCNDSNHLEQIASLEALIEKLKHSIRNKNRRISILEKELKRSNLKKRILIQELKRLDFPNNKEIADELDNLNGQLTGTYSKSYVDRIIVSENINKERQRWAAEQVIKEEELSEARKQLGFPTEGWTPLTNEQMKRIGSELDLHCYKSSESTEEVLS